jgi:hypothetical protein
MRRRRKNRKKIKEKKRQKIKEKRRDRRLRRKDL